MQVGVVVLNYNDYTTTVKCINMERYVKTRCLTEMRYKMIKSSDIRISAGGRITGYSGIMPGVLEEVLIAIKEEKPLYLLGGFGGITEKICKMMLYNNIPDELNEEWQKIIYICVRKKRICLQSGIKIFLIMER